MDAMFNTHHPKDGVRGGRGLFRDFFLKLKTKFSPKYDDKVLHLVTRMLTRFRIRRMNKEFRLAELKKRLARKKGKKSPITLRGTLQLANRVNS